MSIKSREKKIFEEYKKIFPNIISDGVVDENLFLNARYKIVYILKEVNSEGDPWDLCKFLYDEGGRYQTWDNIARWTKGILNWETELNWSTLNDYNKDHNKERRLKYLKKIAAINLKKTQGGHTSSNKEIRKESPKYKDIIKQQIALYKPDFIICCGTYNTFVDIYYEDVAIEPKETKRGVEYFYDQDCIIINFSHPEARVNDAYLYYALIDAVREIMRNKSLKA